MLMSMNFLASIWDFKPYFSKFGATFSEINSKVAAPQHRL